MKTLRLMVALLTFAAANAAFSVPVEDHHLHRQDFNILDVSGMVNSGLKNAQYDYVTLTGGHSNMYDFQDLSSNKGISLKLLDCTDSKCNSINDFSLVKTLTSGQSFNVNAALPNANNHWIVEVISNATTKVCGNFHFQISSVPEPESIVLMLLGMVILLVKFRPRTGAASSAHMA